MNRRSPFITCFLPFCSSSTWLAELVTQTLPQRATTNNFASSEIQSRDVDNDPLLGMRVLRRFAGFGEFWGIITFRRSPGPGRTWYKVEYDDGDSEEYNLKDI